MLSRANQAWFTFGNIIQLIFALGLHRGRTKKSPPESNIYIIGECRKRTFWTVYTLDRYFSILLGRPRLLHDEDIDQEIPDKVNDEDMTPIGIKVRTTEEDCVEEAAIFHAG